MDVKQETWHSCIIVMGPWILVKTIEILKVAYNYEEQGKSVVIMTSALDTRDGVGYVSSRIGMKRPAIAIEETTDIFGYIRDLPETPYCVLVDEAQFLKRHHVYDLARVVDELDIPVMAFGLKNDFRNELFEGSKYLLLLADKIDEIKTICQYCKKKATMVVRTQDGLPVYDGEQIQIGGNETYISVCRKHYFAPLITSKKEQDYDNWTKRCYNGNYFDVLHLDVKEYQKQFIATNVISLAEAYVYTKNGDFVAPLAVYDNDAIIGFVMLAYDKKIGISKWKLFTISFHDW